MKILHWFRTHKSNHLNSFTVTVIILIVISVLLKSFFFVEHSTFMNDDHSYYNMAKHLIKSQIISVDGVQNHTIFPPGYPILISIQSLFSDSFRDIKFFQFVFIGTFFSVISSIAGYRAFGNKYIFVMIFLHPAFILSASTLGVSSESWYSVFIWSGLILCFSYIKNNKTIFLLYANLFFCFSYLIRPEALAFFGSSFAAFIYNYQSVQELPKNHSIKSLIMWLLGGVRYLVGNKTILIFVTPVVLFVLPYILYLYNNTGYISISGKSLYNARIVQELYASSTDHIFTNFIGILRNFIAPYFINPVITVGVIMFIYLAIKGKIKLTIFHVILFTPFIIVILSLLNYLPWARALYVFVPMFMFISLQALEYYLDGFGNFLKYLVFICINIIFIVIIYSAIYRGVLCNNPVMYDKIVDKIVELEYGLNNEILVLTRNPKIDMNNKFINSCTFKSENLCAKLPDYIIVSNSEHISLGGQTEIEKNVIDLKSFLYNKMTYESVAFIERCNDNKINLFKLVKSE
ncbi:hypothetical protein HN615_13830 [Candidatus Woesearchaeota archaeon]|jgi:hypothetical protein|nr:hypothetical protein [Candidatus Woesearchaeota archaeon]